MGIPDRRSNLDFNNGPKRSSVALRIRRQQGRAHKGRLGNMRVSLEHSRTCMYE